MGSKAAVGDIIQKAKDKGGSRVANEIDKAMGNNNNVQVGQDDGRHRRETVIPASPRKPSVRDNEEEIKEEIEASSPQNKAKYN